MANATGSNAAKQGQDKLDEAFEKLQQETPDFVTRTLCRLRKPQARIVRIPLGLLFICAGFLWFLPALGRIEALRWPTGEGIRVDPGIEVGTEIGGRFDPMLAKIIARGDTRAQALERVSLLAEGWGGGTRIGECLATFAKHHAQRALRGRAGADDFWAWRGQIGRASCRERV